MFCSVDVVDTTCTAPLFLCDERRLRRRTCVIRR